MQIAINIIFPIISFVVILLGYYFKLKNELEKIALGAINKAEDLDLIGEEKFKIAVSIVQDAIPKPWKTIFNQEAVETLVQVIFDEVQEFAKKQVK